MPRWSVLILALFVTGCFAPKVPNDDLVRACTGEPTNWRHQTIAANTVMTADWVNLLDPKLHWTNRTSVVQGYDPCAACASLLLRGFSSVEYLPTSSASLDRVWPYTFAKKGDARCEFSEHPDLGIQNQPPMGECLAVEHDVPRSARYGIDLFNTGLNAQWIDKWTYELVDLQQRAVVAHATEFYQSGMETAMYECRDVHIERRDASRFVEQSIQPIGVHN